MQTDRRAHELQEHQRGHRQAERLDGLLRRDDRGALVDDVLDLAHEAGEDAVHDERRGVLGEDRGLLQLLGDAEGRGQRGVVGLLTTDDLQQREDRDRVEEVEADHALRVLELGGHLRHRQRGGVGGEDRVRRGDRLDLREHLLLDGHLLEHGLDDEVRVREALGLVQDAGHQGGQAVGLVLVDAALAEQLLDLGVDVAHTLVHALLVDVGEDHRHLQAAQEEQRQLRGHQARADDADLGDRTGQGLVRGTGRALGALLHQVEGVDARAQLAAHDEVGQRRVLGVEAGLQVARLGGGDDVQRAVGGGSGAVHLGVRDEAALGDGRVPGLAAVDLVADDLGGAVQDVRGPQERLLQEVRALEQRVGDAQVEDLLAAQLLVLVERVLDDHRDRALGADQVRQDGAAAPAGNQAEEDLGQREGRDGLRDGAVGAVQTDLDAAAHGRAVVVREGRDRQRREALEDVVAALADGERLVVLLQQLDTLEVGADREDERLAGDARADDGAGDGLLLDLVDRRVQVGERLRTEGGRLGVVEAVVQRDEREAPGAERQVQVADVRGRDDLVREQLGRALQELSGGAHLESPSALKFGFSQMTVAPMPKPTHMVVRP